MAEKYTSLYKKDPIAAELEAGIQGTDVYQGSPYALSSVPEFEGIKSATTDYNRYQDLYNLYLGGGFDAAQDDFVTPPATTPGGSGGGGGEATLPGFDVDSPKNTPFEQNLLDQGIGVQGAPGDPVVAPGEMPVTQEEMDAFNQIPVSSDPFLVSGAAGGASLEDIDLDQVDLGNPTGDPRIVPEEQETQGSPYGINPTTGQPYQTPRSIADQNAVLGQTFEQQKDPAQWEALRDKFVQTGQDVGNFFTDLKDKGIDIGNMAGTAILNLAGKAALGIPLLGTAIDLIGGAESASGAQQKLVSDQFEEEGVTLDDIGRIQQVGLDYDTPENVMARYSPGETGIRIGDISVGGGTIQESIVDRLSTLEKTKNEKYNGSFYNADGTPKLNPDTGEPTKLGQREEALKENLNTVARAAGGDTITEYDPITKTAGITLGSGEAGFLDDTSDLVTKEEQDAINLQEAVDAGIQSADDDSGSEMLDTSPVIEDDLIGYDEHYDMVEPTTPTGIIKPATNRWDTYPPDYITDWQTMGDDYDIDISQDAPTTSAFDAEAAAIEQAAAQRVMQEQIAAERRESERRAANQRAEVTRQNEIRRQAEIDRLAAARREAARRNQGGGGEGDRSGGRSSSSGESDYGGFCFDPNTRVQMADGSEKRIKEIQLGDNTKGGEVTGVFQFKATDEIHDYKGVTVAGSHYVKEDGKFIMVQDSPISVKIDKIPVVYSLDTTGRRIFIKDIEFADYNGDGIAKGFLHNAGLELNGFNKEVLRQVENRLI